MRKNWYRRKLIETVRMNNLLWFRCSSQWNNKNRISWPGICTSVAAVVVVAVAVAGAVVVVVAVDLQITNAKQ